MLKNYKLILFDAGGTLLYPYPSVGHIYQEIAAKHGCSVEIEFLNEAFVRVWREHDGLAHLKSHSDEKIERDWWRQIVSDVFEDKSAFNDFENFFDDLYHHFATPDCWRLYPEVHEVLAELKSREKKLAIVSNWDSRLLKLCEMFDLSKYFDFILISAVFGASKPSAKIFEEALRLGNSKAHEAAHIGDSHGDDVRGASQAGLAPFHLCRKDGHSEVSDSPGFKEVPVISNLKALL